MNKTHIFSMDPNSHSWEQKADSGIDYFRGPSCVTFFGFIYFVTFNDETFKMYLGVFNEG